MSNPAQKRRDMSPLESRYRKAKASLMHRIFQLPFKDRKPYEIEASWLFKSVEDYGFRGFPYLTIVPFIEKIESMLRNDQLTGEGNV